MPYLEDMEAVASAIDEFLGEGEEAAAEVRPSAPAAVHTILFTDIEGSTAMTQRLGDTKARDVLREHERIVREALKSHPDVNERDPEGIPIPYVIPGFTDGGSFKQLGVRWFGFSPLRFPKDSKVSYPALYHAADERAPVEGFRWGLETRWNAVTRFCGKP